MKPSAILAPIATAATLVTLPAPSTAQDRDPSTYTLSFPKGSPSIIIGAATVDEAGAIVGTAAGALSAVGSARTRELRAPGEPVDALVLSAFPGMPTASAEEPREERVTDGPLAVSGVLDYALAPAADGTGPATGLELLVDGETLFESGGTIEGAFAFDVVLDPIGGGPFASVVVVRAVEAASRAAPPVALTSIAPVPPSAGLLTLLAAVSALAALRRRLARSAAVR